MIHSGAHNNSRSWSARTSRMSQGAAKTWVVGCIAVLLQIASSDSLAVAGNAHSDGDNTSLRGREFVSEALTQPADVATTLYSADGFFKCVSDLHITPTSTQEISELIKLHTAGDSKPLKIRASRRGSHSSAGFACPGRRGSTKLEHHAEAHLKIEEPERDAARNSNSITLLLHLMNRVVVVDAERHQLTVEAGMTLLDLTHAAEANHMSVLAAIYGNLSVGGVIATSAHGSGLGTACSLGDLVTRVTWVNGRGDVVVSDIAEPDKGAAEVRALVGGLGLLGIITEFTLQLQPPSVTVVETRNDLDDSNIALELEAMLKQETPHIVSFWRPDLGTFRANLFTHVGSRDALPASAPPLDPEARAAYLAPVDDPIASSLGEMLAAWGNDSTEIDSDSADLLNAGVCSIGEVGTRKPFLSDGNGLPVHHATLPTHRAMLAADCSPKCSYQQAHMGAVTEDVEFTIKLSQFEEWVQDVKAIVKSELAESEARLQERYGHGHKPVKSCLPPGSFLLRFGQGSNTLLSTNTGTEDVVFIQWTLLTSAMTPRVPGKHTPISEALEQLSLCKYGARPHWGKNHERVFRHPTCHVRDNFPAANIEQMVALQRRHDPAKMFEPALFRHVLHRSGPRYSPLCALQLWCYCTLDAHCPHAHSCLPSPLFPAYHICKPNRNSDPDNMRPHDEL